jgi:hypothetical protein
MARLLRWWFAPIRSVSTESHVPGLVTLAWTTPEPTPTRVMGPDGHVLFDVAAPCQEHRVTLASNHGSQVEVLIDAGTATEAVQVRF